MSGELVASRKDSCDCRDATLARLVCSCNVESLLPVRSMKLARTLTERYLYSSMKKVKCMYSTRDSRDIWIEARGRPEQYLASQESPRSASATMIT